MLALGQVFPTSKRNVCTQHIIQNIKKRTVYLNRGKEKEKQKLYKILKNLPLSEYEEHYLEDYNDLLKSKYINQDLKDYLRNRHETRERWVKCYFKDRFSCGTCTTSRIESKHRIYKKFLNSNSRLSEVFQTFKKLEEKSILQYKDEIKQLTLAESTKLSEYSLVKEVKKQYGKYVVDKVKETILESLNYSVQKMNNKWKVYYFVFI